MSARPAAVGEAVAREEAARDVPIAGLAWDDRRGTRGMLLFITSEAMLFVALFFAYFYLGAGQPHWPMDEPPRLMLAFLMLGVLFASSVVLWFAEQWGKHGQRGAARLAVAGTCVLGLVFLSLQVLEYRDHLRRLLPSDDAYASIFYTITSVHGLHLILGLAMLGYALLLPAPEHGERPPHRALHNAALYWHFVDGAWIVIVALLYVLPHLERGG